MFSKMRSPFFTAMRMVTAVNPTIALGNAHALLSYSNQLMVVNQNAHAVRPNSMIAKMRRPLVDAMTKMMPASSAS